jgi:hypothetical protein
MKKKALDFGDCVRVVANVHDLDINRYSIEVEFRDIKGNWSHDILPRNIIRSGGDALDELLGRGAVLPTGPGAEAQLANLLSVVPDRTYRITSKTGWHEKSFVLLDVTIGRTPIPSFIARKNPPPPIHARKATWMAGSMG